jgi:hypothetical protein
MSQIPLFLQFEGDPRVELVTLDENAGIDAVRAKAVELGLPGLADAYVFHEGNDKPLDEKHSLKAQGVGAKHRLILHHCRQIHADFRFVEKTKQHPFMASATVGAVKAWFVDALTMPEADASEHVLQLTGTKDRPGPDVMIGSLTTDQCRVALSLVPIKRVEG